MKDFAAVLASVIPAQAGIQFVALLDIYNNQMNNLDSHLRGNDGRSVASSSSMGQR